MVWDMLAVAHGFIPLGLKLIAKMQLWRAAPFKDNLK
jgi:hypothetical protein